MEKEDLLIRYRRALGQCLITSQDGERNPSNSEYPQPDQSWELALAPTRRFRLLVWSSASTSRLVVLGI